MALVAVFLGGMIGTGLRLLVEFAVPHGADQFPFSTLAVNLVGSLALGFLVARVWPTASGWLRAGLGAGVLGSFTTFSALTVSLLSLASAGQWMMALAYLLSSVVLGLGAAGLGLRLGRRGHADRADT